MKKFFLSAFFVISFFLYAIYKKNDELTRQKNLVLSQVDTTSSIVTSSAQSSASSLYRDGSYTGISADAYYGNIQVKAIIQNGELTNVEFLDYPSDRSNSIRINTAAMPLLKSEAIQIQNYKVDIVSGATDSSFAFRQSLESALVQAKN